MKKEQKKQFSKQVCKQETKQISKQDLDQVLQDDEFKTVDGGNLIPDFIHISQVRDTIQSSPS